MDALPSTEFRKRFSRLTEPTEVTVNGHVIGEWVPVQHARYVTLQEAKARIAGVRADVSDLAAYNPAFAPGGHARTPDRPFTPVPKPGKRR